jgi:hypothetical protein
MGQILRFEHQPQGTHRLKYTMCAEGAFAGTCGDDLVLLIGAIIG